MAVPSNTTQSYDLRVREDLSRMCEMVNKFETPFYSSIDSDTTEARSPEWSEESLRAADADNAVVEGDDVTPQAQAKPTILQGWVQTFDEVYSVSDIAKIVDTVKSDKEMTRQRLNAGLAVRRDIEKRMCGNYASVKGTASTAGKFAGAQAWIKTAVQFETGGAVGGFNGTTKVTDARTNGTTPVAFTEARMKAAILASWNATSASLRKVLTDGFNKQKFSGMSGIAQNTNEVSKGEKVVILGSADVYVSDYGRHEITASRFMDGRSVLIYTPEKWKKTVLQPFTTKSLGVTGHNDKEMIATTLTLKCLNEAANAAVADCTSS